MMTATYSPEDNKLRLYSVSRLSQEDYARVKAAGFAWAPKQGLFVAPMWTPEREDLLIEMCGEVGDEDTSLVARAEERAERFEDYREARTEDAHRAHAAVSAIADGIPLGQPILVGHHSERHARKDAERIENGMRRAVKMWETAQYWKSRAAGALHAAKYKELPAVRARRIKGLESDIRCRIASYTPQDGSRIMQRRWNAAPDAEPIPHCWVGPKGNGGHWVAVEDLPRIEARQERWLNHLRNRLEYEKAMMVESGGLAADRFNIEVGGRVSSGSEWYLVTKLNRKDGRLMSVSIVGRWSRTLPVEEITDYRPPTTEDAAEKIKAATKLPPLCNFRVDGCKEMTAAEWKRAQTYTDSNFVKTFDATETTATYRHRTMHGPQWSRLHVFLTDAKVVPAPAKQPETAKITASEISPVPDAGDYPEPRPWKAPEPTVFDAMRDALRQPGGAVQVVSAPQLFPTPKDLARRMADAAGILAGKRVLEPSAGTGNLVAAIFNNATGADCVRVVAIEINGSLVAGLVADRQKRLYANEQNYDIRQADFLECNGDLGKFDAVIMNPPFGAGADIKHIEHARGFLKPGGRLVAICANGPRQRERLQPLAEQTGGYWEDLPAGTFESAGTGVNTALVVIEG